ARPRAGAPVLLVAEHRELESGAGLGDRALGLGDGAVAAAVVDEHRVAPGAERVSTGQCPQRGPDDLLLIPGGEDDEDHQASWGGAAAGPWLPIMCWRGGGSQTGALVAAAGSPRLTGRLVGGRCAAEARL